MTKRRIWKLFGISIENSAKAGKVQILVPSPSGRRLGRGRGVSTKQYLAIKASV
ncbi:MAG: hypothetical protein PQ614_03565 [Rickettsiales bacterium]|nr:hypothetical protein [Rickettsiales bacterium]